MQYSSSKFPASSQINSSAIPWAALQENTTTGYCYAIKPCQKAQHRQALMRAAGHSFSPGTTMLLWTRVGRPLPACWLWLVVDGRYGRH